MSLPFEKTLLYIGVKYKLDAVRVLDELFAYFPMYVFDDPPLEYIANSLGEMIVSKSILAGRYDMKTYVGFLKKAHLMDLNEVWDTPTFQDLLYDSDLRRTMDIMSICAFRQEEIFLIAKEKYPDISESQCQTYLDCFANFRGMQFIAKKNFIYSYVGDPVAQRLYLRCLENRSPEYIRSVLNITLKSMDPMTLAIRSAQISLMKTTEHLVSGDDQELRSFLGINMKSASLLQSLGAGSKSAIEELEKLLDGPSPAPKTKVYTVEELEKLKKDPSSPEGDDGFSASNAESSQPL